MLLHIYILVLSYEERGIKLASFLLPVNRSASGVTVARLPLRPRATAPYLLILVVGGVVLLQPVSQRAVLEGARDPVLYLDLPQGLCLGDHLHHAWRTQGGLQHPGATSPGMIHTGMGLVWFSFIPMVSY